MKQKHYWLGSLILVAASISVILNFAQREHEFSNEQPVNLSKAPLNSQGLESPTTITRQTATAKEGKQTDSKNEVESLINALQSASLTAQERAAIAAENAVEIETLALLFNQVAIDYQQQMAYPPFSQPIRDKIELERYVSNVPHHTEIPYPLDSDGEYRARIGLDKFRYFAHETQTIQVSIQVTEGVQIVDSEVQIIGLDQRIYYSHSVDLAQVKNASYEFTVNLSDVWQPDWPTDLQWRIRSEIGQQRLSVVAPFQVVSAVATVNGIHSPIANGAFFDLPLDIETDLEGYYFAQGIVYHQDGMPVLFLSTEGPITQQSTPIAFQIYGPALLDVGIIDNLYLANIELSRLADETGIELFGQATQAQFAIPTLDFTQLTDDLWQDPLFAERLEFLMNLTMNEEN